MREGRHDQHERRVDMINMREELTREMDNVFTFIRQMENHILTRTLKEMKN